MPRANFLPSFALSVALAACQSPPSDLREWKASDHDHTSNPNSTQVEVAADGGSPLAAFGIDEVTLVAWRRNCTSCHGTYGAGDGPQGPMTGARDLTTAEWQDSVSDDAIALAIRKGRGRMPAFELPDSTVTSLVQFVRLMDPRRLAKAAESAAAKAPKAPPPPAHAASSAPPGTVKTAPKP